jgi:hypothetical protein
MHNKLLPPLSDNPTHSEVEALAAQTDRIIVEMNTPGTRRYQTWQWMEQNLNTIEGIEALCILEAALSAKLS